MMRQIRDIVLGLAILGLLAGCSSKKGTGGEEDGPEGTFLDEPIILASSGPIEPSGEAMGVYIFDLSEDTLVKAGRCNDICIGYVSGEPCDRDITVWDNELKEWRLITAGACFYRPLYPGYGVQRHALSTWGIDAAAVLDSGGRLRIRLTGSTARPRVWPLEINPEYCIVTLPDENPYGGGGLAYVQGSFFARVFQSSKLGVMDEFGRIQEGFEPPMELPLGYTFDGESIWIVGVPDTMFKVSLNGDVLCQFSLPTIYHGDLAWDGETLWYWEDKMQEPQVWGIDPEASCSSGDAVITSTFQGPTGWAGYYGSGLAWDGSHLVICSPNSFLYRVERNGTVVDSFPIPVKYISGAVWDGSRICLMSRGPAVTSILTVDEYTIACFRLP